MLKKKNILNTNFLPYIAPSFWFLIIMLLSGSPYQTFMDLQWVVFISGILAIVFILPRLSFQMDTSMKFFMLLLFMIILTMVQHFEFSRLFYWRIICAIVISYSLAKYYGLPVITRVFRKIMIAVAVISLVGYVLVNYTTALDWLPRVSNINNKEYAIGILFNYITVIPERNCGIFWEPGIYATYLILAIAFEILDPSSKHRVWYFIIYTIALITANSTAGFLLGFVVCFLYLFSKIGSKKMGPIPSVISIVFLLFALSILMNLDTIISNTALADNEYIAKLLSENLEGSARVTVIEHNLTIFFQNPIFGAGIAEVSSRIIESADISTPTYILSIFGALGALLPIGFFEGIFKQNNLNIFQKTVILAIIIMILSKEPHLETLFIWVIFFGLLNNPNALGKQVISDAA